jgi:O-antigen/teichoic acid export membrane protein
MVMRPEGVGDPADPFVLSSDLQPPVPTGLSGFARSSAWVMVGYAVTAGAALAISIVVGRALGPESFGVYAYYTWFLRLAPMALALGLPNALMRYVSEHLGAGDPSGARAVVRLVERIRLPVVAVPLLAAGTLAWSRDRDVVLVVLLACAAAAGVFALDLDALLVGLRRFGSLTKIGILASIVHVALAVGAVLAGAGALGFVKLACAGIVVHLLLLGVIGRRAIRRWPIRRLETGERSRILRFVGIMAAAVAIDAFIFGRPEIFFLDLWRSDAEVGLYNAALRMWALGIILPTVAARVLLPEFSTLVGAGRTARLREVYPTVCRAIAVVSVPVAFGGAAVADELAHLFFGRDFGAAAVPAAILLAGSVITAFTAPVSTAMVAGPRPRYVIEVGAVILLVNLALDIVLILRFGTVGAAVATVTSQALALTVGVAIVWTKFGFRYPVASVARAAGAGVVCAVAARVVVDALGGGPVALAVAVGAGGLTYLAAAVALRALRLDELRALGAAAGLKGRRPS